jgi:UDP-glucose 4-epimerase
VFNVCTGVPVSVLDLARCIGDLTTHEPRIQFRPPRPGEIRHSVGSPVLARTALAVPHPIALREGLARVLGWLRSLGQAA